jgi:hypothetical protein
MSTTDLDIFEAIIQFAACKNWNHTLLGALEGKFISSSPSSSSLIPDKNLSTYLTNINSIRCRKAISFD